MATIEQFNAGIDEMRRDYPIAIIAMYDDGQRTIFPLQRGKGIDSFQATVKSGHYEHVALKFGGRIMAIWHRDSKAAAPAQPAGDFGVGDKVVIRKDAIFDSSPLDNYRDKRAVATVTEVYDGQEFDYEIAFGDGNAVDTWLMLADELTLWTPAEPGSDAKDEYTRELDLYKRFYEFVVGVDGQYPVLDILQGEGVDLLDWAEFHNLLEDIHAMRKNEALAEAQEDVR